MKKVLLVILTIVIVFPFLLMSFVAIGIASGLLQSNDPNIFLTFIIFAISGYLTFLLSRRIYQKGINFSLGKSIKEFKNVYNRNLEESKKKGEERNKQLNLFFKTHLKKIIGIAILLVIIFAIFNPNQFPPKAAEDVSGTYRASHGYDIYGEDTFFYKNKTDRFVPDKYDGILISKTIIKGEMHDSENIAYWIFKGIEEQQGIKAAKIEIFWEAGDGSPKVGLFAYEKKLNQPCFGYAGELYIKK